ncbi:16S rRNA (cytosine(967)-C(5))-methyltransferase RsmB [Paenibacillus mendelii]|uniref:16S rRNA (cytosine(967)-C(5))-methyltransferase n=1 Tax=Paenibacillus mendelii TaxID=206163 RepID=A0ABV6J618_9BACL|nr:16S rRNA (cytosine(967)-C(5))-methyltransferase RsmB [Paenibacillus mendelii]MCQ6560350.1 16S rRNA (cytosine(967)-C(5))-methyltransferase RsmB [Paenibacillus mendelii]
MSGPDTRKDLPASKRRKNGGGGRKAPGSAAAVRNGGPASQGGGSSRKPKPQTAREVALNTLVKVAASGAYSNLQLNSALQEAGLTRQDAGLATELVYGTIQQQRLLDYRLSGLVAKGLDKLNPWVLQLLRLSAYQLLCLDRIPAHAAVNEAVQIAKKRGHAGISGMVNGVLRNMERRLQELRGPVEENNPVIRIGVTYSYPDWLVKRWITAYGEAEAEAICASGNESPHPSMRVNRLRLSRDEALSRLAEAGYQAAPSSLAPAGIIVDGGGNLALMDNYAEGLWTMQDESSMLVAEVCAPEPGWKVLDCCAAPGGKSTHLAELMGDQGRVVANDVHPHKRQLIDEQARRLGLDAIITETGDAAELSGRFTAASFDLVLLDAPCSGFGVIRRKPEIKWTKTPEDVQSIAALQRRLLAEAAKLVRPGGTLVYSTCTIEREENEAQVAAFLRENPDFESDTQWPENVLQPLQKAGAVNGQFQGYVQLLPHQFGSDGFFIAKFKHRE